MKTNNEPYSKRGFIGLLILGFFFTFSGISLKQDGVFMFGLLIILGTLGYKEISLRIASGSKRPTIKEFIIILLLIFIYLGGHWFLGIEDGPTAIPFGIVFANYIKLFLPKGNNWKSDLILIVTSIILIGLAIYLAGVGKILNYHIYEYNNRVNYILGEGIELLDTGKYIEAIGAFNKAIELEPKNIDAYYFKGGIVHQLGRYEEALEIFNKILTIDPNNQATHFSKGLTLLMLNRFKESITSFDKAIELNPNDSYSYFRKGYVLDQLGDYNGAMTLYEKSIRLNPSYDLHYYAKGVLLMKDNKNGEATEMFDKCLGINPKNLICEEAKKNIKNKMDALLGPLFDQLNDQLR